MNLYNDQPQHADQLPDEGPGHRPARRTFLVTSVGVGFALAVDPVMAQVITTPTDGLVAGDVQVPVADGQIPAYRAMPDGAGPFPTMIVIEEIFGLHEYIKDICRRFAKLGYFAIAPELFARQGDATKADIKTIVNDIVPKKPDAEAMTDLDSVVAYAASTGKADTAALGAIGFCWGGRQIWLYAEHNPKLKAAVAFYGILGGKASPPTPIKPTNPIDFRSPGDGAGARALRWPRRQHPARSHRQDERRDQRHEEPDRPLPRRAAWLLRRLSPELPSHRGEGRMGQGTGVVQGARGGVSWLRAARGRR